MKPSIRTLSAVRCVLAAPLFFALSALSVPQVESATHAVGSINGRCEDYPYAVVCLRNRNQGGPIGCFDTACDAQAAGAYQCRTSVSACEPH